MQKTVTIKMVIRQHCDHMQTLNVNVRMSDFEAAASDFTQKECKRLNAMYVLSECRCLLVWKYSYFKAPFSIGNGVNGFETLSSCEVGNMAIYKSSLSQGYTG
ncbi:hypothetical protein CHS0354_018224 [Potamilus streckersoni]|uniref:Uncharacterized protein n=1 Tax=Potamilus streckersoni TaxID=2493646 RepID=A0AAE0VY01_9BIVA|nr:hypothetical protein CHS0354_018224 [Potamilus streckersoni]